MPGAPADVFEHLVESAQDGIARVEYFPTKRFAFVNAAQCRLTGRTAEEFYADPDLALRIVHPEDQAKILQMRAGEEAEPILMRIVRKDGSIRWTESRIRAQRDEQGRVVAIESFNRDVTDRVRAEERFRAAVDTMLDAFSVYRAVRDAEGRIVDFQAEFVNDAAASVSGLGREAMLGRSMAENFPAARESSLFQDYVRCVETKTALSRDDVRAPSGRYYDLRVSSFQDGFVVSWRDVTARRRGNVAKDVVRKYFRSDAHRDPAGAAHARSTGRALAAEVRGDQIEAFLDAYGGMGLGELKVATHEGDRWTFHGDELLDVRPAATSPTCMTTLGFLEAAVEAVARCAALGTETACRSVGAPRCTFIVAQRPRAGAAAPGQDASASR